jgi:vWA-MoxR associated protein C-terminal domain/Effector-associated domain 2
MSGTAPFPTGPSAAEPEHGRLVSDAWTPTFTGELAASLNAFPDMDDPAFRNSLLRRTAERLGMDSTFPVDSHSDRRVYINAIVFACKDYIRPAAAVTALVETMKELRPYTSALVLLEDCEAALKGLSILGAARLHSVLTVINGLSGRPDRLTVHDLVRRAAREGEVLPLQGSEDLPEVVQRLDAARESSGAAPPLVVRFLGELAASLEGDEAPRLAAQLEKITAELRLPPDAVLRARGHRPSKKACRVLQIRIDDVSSAAQEKYTIDGAVLDRAEDSWERIASWPPDGDCMAKDIDEAGTRFLQQAGGLDRAVGGTADMTVEFLLPWSLLGHPVEQWAIDEDDYWIGHRFPVVVGSLDRRRKPMFFQPWLERWKMLFGEGHDRPLCERLGWLHNGDAPVPDNARNAGRFIQVTKRGDLTSWLEEDTNRSTASLGLTFAYRHDDLVGLTSLKAAVCEGIPVLVWRRDNGDPNELEHLLTDVNIHDLRNEVFSWRRLAAGNASNLDVRRHFVVMWDDPGDIGQPYDQLFMAPQ